MRGGFDAAAAGARDAVLLLLMWLLAAGCTERQVPLGPFSIPFLLPLCVAILKIDF